MIQRPQLFKDIKGQENVKNILLNSLNKHDEYHAYLFSGTRGVGKTTLARIFATSINCTNFISEPCMYCENCIHNSDVIERDASSHRGINEIKELINSLRYAPLLGRKKILILDEVHMLTNDAFGVLLKFIEEPPLHLIMIFITTEIDNLPKTFLSRCIELFFCTVSNTHIQEYVDLYYGQCAIEVKKFIIRSSHGSLREAKVLIENFMKLDNFTEVQINFETEENFSFFLNINNSEEKLYDKLVELNDKGCNIRKFWYSFIDVCIEEKSYTLAADIDFILFQFKNINSFLSYSCKIIRTLKRT